MSLRFRWLGAAGVVIKAGDQVLALDPFFTRPSLRELLRPVNPDTSLVGRKLPRCNALLVTHSHWDHLLDVAEVLRQTGAAAYGSPNTCQLLKINGVPGTQVHEVGVGDKLSLGAFKVEVIAGRHSRIPFARLFNGALRPNLQPPLHVWDYRMDVCLGYRITVMGTRLLVCAGEPQPAEVLFTVAQEPKVYYQRLLVGTQPHTFIPIHWDNFLRGLERPLRRFSRPGGMSLWQLARLARQAIPGINVIIPEIFREYTLRREQVLRIN